jgi:hypothetical protein
VGVNLVVDLQQLAILESRLRNAVNEFVIGIQPIVSSNSHSVDLWGGHEIIDALDHFSDSWKRGGHLVHDRSQVLADFVLHASQKYIELEAKLEKAAKN